MNHLRRRLFLACLEDRVTPAAGALDPTFSTDGRATTDLGSDDRGAAVAVQPDGKVIVAGTTGAASPDFVVARYNADGSLDGTFGTGGVKVVSFGASDVATSVAIQADGRIVVAGYTNQLGDNDFAAARLNPDGSLDTTFDTDGRVIVPFDLGLLSKDDRANAVAIQQDGSIVLAGSVAQTVPGDTDFGVARLKSDGSLDTTFSADGKQAVAFDLGLPNEDKANAVVIQSDGKIVVGGYASNGTDNDFAVARLTGDGTLDPSFDTDGRQTVNFGNDDQVNALALRPDGRIVAAGSWTGSASDFAVAQFTPAGALDPTFGGGLFPSGSGKFNLSFGTGSPPFEQQEFATGVAVQPDGKVVVSGYSDADTTGGPNFFAVARLLPDGSGLDTTFGSAGKVLVDFGGDDKAAGLALQPDGRIVVAGSTITGGSGDFAVARLQGDVVALSVSVSEPAVAVAGNTVTYTVTVANAGPNTATDVPVTAAQLLGPVAFALTDIAHTSTATGGATGNSSGAGSVNDTLTLPAGSSVTYVITGSVPQNAHGTLQLAASATTPAGVGETDVLNNTASVTTPIIPSAVALLVGGPNDGTARVFTAAGGKFTTPGTSVTFFPAAAGVNVRTAAADVNGDGVADFIGGTGPGAATNVTVVDGKTGTQIASFQPFESSFTGGVFVAVGDFNNDGKADVIVTPDQGGGPVVAIYDGALLTAGKNADAQLNRFFGIEDPAFRGGARAAAGDVTGDGRADLAVSAGFLGGPRIAVFDGAGLGAGGTATPAHLVPDFFAFENTLRNGAFVAVGDVDGDGRADLAFGGGPGGAPRVRVFDGKALVAAAPFSNLDAVPAAQVANFFAGDNTLRGGVRLTLKDVNADGKADLVAGSGEGEASRVRLYTSPTLLGSASPTADQEFDTFGLTLPNGVFVG